ncbi:MAG TPA: ParB/RepB/Spo0J family partition protein [Thermomicrobiales bacterium]|nr:ParB/RepB/Spo0J family partition protein [Thermomicrobiales bacterium]
MSTNEAEQLSLLPELPLYFGEVEEFALDDIAPDAYLAGPAPDPSFVASLRDLGQIDPVVLEAARGEAFAYYVRSGKRRVKAARILGWATIEARVVAHQGDPVVSAVVELAANAQRRENPLSDLDAIEAVQAAAAARGLTLGHAAIAKATGLAVPTIKKRLALRRLEPDLRDALAEGRLSVGLAERVAKLPPARQRALALTEGKITGPLVREATRARVSAAAAALDFSFLDGAGDGNTPPERTPDEERGALGAALLAAVQRGLGECGLAAAYLPCEVDGGEWRVALPSGARARVTLTVDEIAEEES